MTVIGGGLKRETVSSIWRRRHHWIQRWI